MKHGFNIHLGTRTPAEQKISRDCCSVVVVSTDLVKDYVLGLVEQVGTDGLVCFIDTTDKYVGSCHRLGFEMRNIDHDTGRSGNRVFYAIDRARIGSARVGEFVAGGPELPDVTNAATESFKDLKDTTGGVAKMIVVNDGTMLIQANDGPEIIHDIINDGSICLVLVVTPASIAHIKSNIEVLPQADAKVIFHMDVQQAKSLCETLNLPNDAANEIVSLSDDDEVLVCIDGACHKCIRPEIDAQTN